MICNVTMLLNSQSYFSAWNFWVFSCLRSKQLITFLVQSNLSNTGQSKVSVLERCPFKRGHYNDVTQYDSTYSFQCSVAKTRPTLVFKRHLNLSIHSTKTLSFSSIRHCTSQLQSKHSRRLITVLKRNELQRNAASKKL